MTARTARPCPRRRHRGRGDRLLGRLPPGPRRLDRRRPARARPAHLRDDLARRRPDDLLRLDVGDLDRHPALLPRPLRAARGRDRAGHRLPAGRADRGGRRRATGSRSTAASRPSSGTSGSRSTRSPRAEMAELFPLGQDRRPARRLPRPRRRPGQPRRPHRRARQGRPAARRTRRRGRLASPTSSPRRSRTETGRPGVRDRRRRRRVRVRRQLHRHVGPRAGRPQRAGDPQPGGRALLPDHRHDRGHRPGRADLRGPGLLRLLPRGGRRDDGRPLRAARRGRGRSRASRPTSPSARCPPDWDRMAPFLEKAMARVPVTLEVGVRTFFCGPESFTPDLAPAVGEAPGVAQLLRRRGHELRRRPVRRRPRPGAGALDHRRVAPTSTSPASTSTGSGLPGRRRLPRRAHHRDPRHRLRRAHARQAAAHRPQRAALPRPRPAGRPGRLPARGLRLGGRRLVRRPGRRPGGRADVGPGARGSSSGRPSTARSARASG